MISFHDIFLEKKTMASVDSSLIYTIMVTNDRYRQKKMNRAGPPKACFLRPNDEQEVIEQCFTQSTNIKTIYSKLIHS